jgi:hypothetical protein
MQTSVPPELCTRRPKCLILIYYFNFVRSPKPPNLFLKSFANVASHHAMFPDQFAQTVRSDSQFPAQYSTSYASWALILARSTGGGYVREVHNSLRLPTLTLHGR